MGEGTARSLGVQSLMRDMGLKYDVVISLDSSAAKSMAGRQGIGRVRHMETKWLWVQQAVRDGRIKIKKISGTDNPADVPTKFLTAKQMNRVLNPIGIYVGKRSN